MSGSSPEPYVTRKRRFRMLARPSVAYTLFALFTCSVLFAVVKWIPLSDVQQLMDPQPPLPSLAVSELPVPSGEYLDVAWLKDWLIVEHPIYEPSPHPNDPSYPDIMRYRLWKLHPDGTGMQMLDLPQCQGNKYSDFRAPVRLGSATNTFSYVVTCVDPNDIKDPSYVRAYDLNTGKASDLHDGFLRRMGFPAGAYTWDPGVTKGVLEEASGVEERLHWVTRTTVEPIRLDLSRSIIPAWSPNGKWIAFWGQ